MARIRTIKPEFFRHLDLYKAEIEDKLPLRLAYAGLWTSCDREGRFKWKPEELKLDSLPYDNVDFSRVLDALWTRGFVEKYMSENKFFGFIPSWNEHQYINNRESESSLPNPYESNILTRDGRVTDASETCTRGREGKGKEYYMTIFNEFRKIYPGKKRGNETEFGNFINKQKNYEFVIDLLKPAIEGQIKEYEELKSKGKWVPEWANLQTWINQKRWEMVSEIEQESKQDPKMYYIDQEGNKKPLIKKS